MMATRLFDWLHAAHVHPRRVRVLAEQVAKLLAPSAKVLDVGCGDGRIAAEIYRRRPDLSITGIDVLVRPDARIPTNWFDGERIPFDDDSFDSVVLIDVLHHTLEPGRLLREAMRVARNEVIVKDHTLDSLIAGPILRFMDHAGNDQHGVASVYKYWPTVRWRGEFAALNVRVADWITDPPLYPWPANLLFGRHLHFIARLLLPQPAP